MLFVSTMLRTLRILDGTVWATRGWTYQERLPSKGCLVIIEKQAHFICKTLGASEYLQHDMAPRAPRAQGMNTVAWN